MVVIISILAMTLAFMIIDIAGSLYIGDSSNYNDNKRIISHLEGAEKKAIKTRRKISIKNWGLDKVKKRISGNLENVCAFAIAMLLFGISYKAFDSVYMGILGALCSLIIPKEIKESRKLKQHKELTMQFREAIKMINNSLKAGQSINNAIIRCSEDMEVMYSQKKDIGLIDSFKKIKFNLEIGTSIDDALREFSDKWNNEDIKNFCDAIIAVRLKGGNMVEIMDNVTKMITDKMDVDMEISRQTASKKFESRIFCCLPIVVFLLLSIISKEYMSPMYDTPIGKVLVVISVILVLLNYRFSRKITNIEV